MNPESMLAVWRDQLGHAHQRHNHMDAERLAVLKLIMAVHAALLIAVVLRGEAPAGKAALAVQIGVGALTLTLFTVHVKRMVYTHRCKAWIKDLEQVLYGQLEPAPSNPDLPGTYYWSSNLAHSDAAWYSVASAIPFVNTLVPCLAALAMGAPMRAVALIGAGSLFAHLVVGWMTYRMAGVSPYSATVGGPDDAAG